jgi:signal recognition particle subunit SRP19
MLGNILSGIADIAKPWASEKFPLRVHTWHRSLSPQDLTKPKHMLGRYETYSHKSFNTTLQIAQSMRKQEKYVIWPAYFDQGKTRSEGRKVPKNQAQLTPRLEEIQKAAQKLGLQPESKPEFAHPAQPWQKTGMLLINKKGTKLETMRKIAKEIATQRALQTT